MVRETFSRHATLLVWCAALWFDVVYLGEHYSVDMRAGVGLAAAGWWILNHTVTPRCQALGAARALPPLRAVEIQVAVPVSLDRRACREVE